MSETVSVNIQMDPNLKEQAETLFQNMGLNMTSAVNLFVRQTLLQGKIPFAIYADPFYSESHSGKHPTGQRGQNCRKDHGRTGENGG